jgi:hypothetical protein
LDLPEGVEGAIGVYVHADLALDHLDHTTVLVDHERHPLGRLLAGDAHHARHRAIGIGEQRVVEPVLVGELVLLVDRVAADAHALTSGGGELGPQVAEVAALLRAARRHRRRVEEQHHWPVRQQVAQLARRARLVGQLEIVDHVPYVHVRTVVREWRDRVLPVPPPGTERADASDGDQ